MQLRNIIVLLSVLATVSATPVTAQIITASVTTSDVELFQFDTTTGGANKVIVAKFVTEDPSPGGPMVEGDPLDNLRFELETEVLSGSTSFVADRAFQISDANVDVLDGDSVQVVQLRAQETTESAFPGNRIIKIRVRFQYGYVFDPAETWAIRAKSLASGNVHFWGFEEEDPDETTAEAAATKPYLIEYMEDSLGQPDVTNFGSFVDLPTSKNLTFGTVHVNSSDAFAISKSYEFINVGTASLDIVGVAETSGGGSINLPHGGYSATGYFTTPSPVLPMAALTGTVFRFNPTATGSAPDVNIDLTTTSSTIPLLEVNLVGGYGIRIQTGLLIDISGSMNDDVHGNRSVDSEGKPTNLESERKIYKARDAARYFVDVYRQNVPEAEIGLLTYPNLAGQCPSAQQVVNFDDVQSLSTFTALHDQRLSRNHQSRIRPEDEYFLTPMSDGLELVLQSMASVPTDTKRLVLMVGDGQHYCSASEHTPSQLESSLSSSGIIFHTVPYGDDNAAWTQQLEDIADWTGGDSYPVNLDDEDDLKKEAENVLREVIGLETLTDPGGSIQRNQIIRDKVCVPEEEYVLNFLVRWENQKVGAISVELETPDGSRINKSTASSQPADVGYFETESFIGFTVRGSYLSGRNGVGEWWIELTGTNNIGEGDQVDFAYSVYSQSTLKSDFDIGPWFAGYLSSVELFIENDAQVARNYESATLRYRAPTQSFGTWFATTYVDPERVIKVPDDVPGSPVSLADKKYWLLSNELGQQFDPKWEVRTIEMAPKPEPVKKAAGGERKAAAKASSLYAELPEAAATGLYEFTGMIQGVTFRGDCFQREISWVQDVRLQFTPELILKYIDVLPVEISALYPPSLLEQLHDELPSGTTRSAVRVTLKDDSGRYARPGYGDRLTVTVNDGVLLEPYVDNLDGSYTFIVQYDESFDPQLTFSVDGVTTPATHLSEIEGGPNGIPWLWILIFLLIIIIVIVIIKRF